MTDPAPASAPAGIDPRQPRVAAAITATLLALALLLALTGAGTRARTTLGERVADPGLLLSAVLAGLFAWGFLAPRTAPWGVLYRALLGPRLPPPAELEDPRPPRFAQVVGFTVVTTGVLLHLVGVPFALPVAVAAAFVAAFLNAVFDYCLGCQLYLLLARAGAFGRPARG